MLLTLADGNASARELVARAGVSDLFHHLHVLGRAGLVTTGIDGLYGLASHEVAVLVLALGAVARNSR